MWVSTQKHTKHTTFFIVKLTFVVIHYGVERMEKTDWAGESFIFSCFWAAEQNFSGLYFWSSPLSTPVHTVINHYYISIDLSFSSPKRRKKEKEALEKKNFMSLYTETILDDIFMAGDSPEYGKEYIKKRNLIF